MEKDRLMYHEKKPFNLSWKETFKHIIERNCLTYHGKKSVFNVLLKKHV